MEVTVIETNKCGTITIQLLHSKQDHRPELGIFSYGDVTIIISPSEKLCEIMNELQELLSRSQISTINEVESLIQLADKYVDYRIKTKTIRIRVNGGLIPNYGISYKIVPEHPEEGIVKAVKMKEIIRNNTIMVEEKVARLTQALRDHQLRIV